MLFLLFVGCKQPVLAPTCDNEIEFACFSGIFKTLLGSPVPNVEVCAPEQVDIECTKTDSEGAWKMSGLPLEANVFITATHPDYVSSLFPQHTSMSWYEWYKVAIPKSIMDSNANRLDIELDNTKGNVLFLTWEGLNIDGVDTDNVSDVTAETTPNVDYLFYGDALGLASINQESTTNSGSGGILNVNEGEIQLLLDSPQGYCASEHMFHYLTTDEQVVPVPIRAGFTTAIDVICPSN